MSNTYELSASVREVHGKGASRRLRRLSDSVPAILYGGESAPQSIQIPHKDVLKALQNEGFYSHILTIHVAGKPIKAVLKDIQRHPYKPRVMHMDFQRITGKEKIHMHVPVHYTNEEKSPGAKDGGVISHYVKELEVVCMPDKLPEYFEIDLGNLVIGDVIHLDVLKVPKGVELVLLQHGENPAMAAIHMPRVVVEEVETPAEIVEAEATPEAPAAESETPPSA